MTAPELKPCPFCGGEATVLDEGDNAWVACFRCQISLEGFATEADAITAWNTRAPDPDLEAHIGAALTVAADRATARWAARREHADRLAEMDYAEALIDAKTVSAKADEAEMIAAEILALRPDALTALDRAKRKARVEGMRAALGPCDEWTYACDAADAIRALIEKEGKP